MALQQIFRGRSPHLTFTDTVSRLPQPGTRSGTGIRASCNSYHTIWSIDLENNFCNHVRAPPILHCQSGWIGTSLVGQKVYGKAGMFCSAVQSSPRTSILSEITVLGAERGTGMATYAKILLFLCGAQAIDHEGILQHSPSQGRSRENQNRRGGGRSGDEQAQEQDPKSTLVSSPALA